MTIIFGGIDFPVFEMLFIVSILLIIGLVLMILGIFYVLKELRELKNLIKTEETNIQKFERDITELERFEGKKDNTEALKNYIGVYLQRGLKWEQIKAKLVSRGWKERDLDEIYMKLKLK